MSYKYHKSSYSPIAILHPKHTYYSKYGYYQIIIHHPFSSNYPKSIYYSKTIIYPKYSYYPIVTLYNTLFMQLPSKLGLNFDLVLCSLSVNRPQLTTQSLLFVKPLLVERCFHFQVSIWLFAQHHVYLQMFQLCELRANNFDDFRLLAVQCLHFKSSTSGFANFSLLHCPQDLFALSLPKFICNMLNCSPTLLTVSISWWEASRRW